jgi:hypothetical protein
MGRGHAVAPVVIDPAHQQRGRSSAATQERLMLLCELHSDRIEQLASEDRLMLGRANLAAMDHLPDVEAVPQEVGEGAAGKGDPSDGVAVREPPHLRDDPPLAKVPHQRVQAAELEIAAEDEPHPFSLFVDDHELLVPALIAERHHAADP